SWPPPPAPPTPCRWCPARPARRASARWCEGRRRAPCAGPPASCRSRPTSAAATRPSTSCRATRRSTLDRARGEALHHPALDEDVERDDGDRGDDGGRHQLAPGEHVAVDQEVQPHRDRERRLVLDEDQRVEELVPGER